MQQRTPTDGLPRVVQQAVSRLLRKSPFLGLFLVRLPIQLDEQAGTAVTDGASIRIAPSFARTLTLEHATSVLAHLVHHVLLLHHIPQRRGDRDPRLWHDAADFVVNLILTRMGFRLPEGSLFDPFFRGMSTEQVYAILKQRQQSKPSPGGSKSQGAESNPRDPGRLGRVEDAKISEGGESGDTEDRGEVARQLTTETAVHLAVQQARQHARAIGQHLHRDIERQIRWTYERSQVDWTETLWRFVDVASSASDGDWSWTRPSPWFLQQNIVMPTLVSEGLDVLPIVVDTSGSITSDQLGAIRVELEAILTAGHVDEIRVLYADTRVRSVESFYAGQAVRLKPRGGGGTDFRAAFKELDRDVHVPAVVFFTDLLGVFPDEPPRYPTLWIHTWPGLPIAPVPFGEVIHMPR